MTRRKIAEILVPLIILIFLVHFLASKFHWYYSIWYLDMVMHFIGGLWAGLGLIYLFPSQNFSLRSVSLMLFLVFVIGAGWEIYEFFVNDFIAKNNLVFSDIFSDLIFDLLGGALGILYYFKMILPAQENRLQ